MTTCILTFIRQRFDIFILFSYSLTTRKKSQNWLYQNELLFNSFNKPSFLLEKAKISYLQYIVQTGYFDLGRMKVKPYKFYTWHKLEGEDLEKRFNFAHWFFKQPKSTRECIICSDEAYLYLKLPVNNQNNCQWSKSQSYIETPLNDQIILVLFAIFRQSSFPTLKL